MDDVMKQYNDLVRQLNEANIEDNTGERTEYELVYDPRVLIYDAIRDLQHELNDIRPSFTTHTILITHIPYEITFELPGAMLSIERDKFLRRAETVLRNHFEILRALDLEYESFLCDSIFTVKDIDSLQKKFKCLQEIV